MTFAWAAWDANQAHGYGKVGYLLRKAVMDAGARILDQRDFGWDAMVCVSTPAAFLMGPNLPRRDMIWHTMFEAEPLPRAWTELINQSGALWVPSDYCRNVFQESGVTVPIMKVGYGIDPIGLPFTERSGRDTPFKFILWAETLVSRKNVLLAAKAFVAANLPNATLEIKINNTLGWNPSISFSDAIGADRDNITLHSGVWDWKDLLAWLHSADAGIYASGGEGFGLMPLEMMSTGLPVICADNTGMREYLTPEIALLVPCPGRMRSPSYQAAFDTEMLIFKPDFDTMVEQIRWAYNNREAAYDIGRRSSPMAQSWTWERTGTLAYAQLRDLHKSGALS